MIVSTSSKSTSSPVGSFVGESVGESVDGVEDGVVDGVEDDVAVESSDAVPPSSSPQPEASTVTSRSAGRTDPRRRRMTMGR